MTQLRRAPRASYVRLSRAGELEERARRFDAKLDDCTVCPHECWRFAADALRKHMEGDRHHLQWG